MSVTDNKLAKNVVSLQTELKDEKMIFFVEMFGYLFFFVYLCTSFSRQGGQTKTQRDLIIGKQKAADQKCILRLREI